MLQPKSPFKAARGRIGRPLLTSCAIGLALAAMARSPDARAQSYLASELPGSIGATVDNTVPGQTLVSVSASRAIVNWQPNDVAAGATPISFQDASTIAEFRGSADFTILNRILPSGGATGRAIQFNGNTISTVNGARGGNVWFYSPGGIMIGATATFDVGSLLLSTLDVTDADFLDGGPYSFASPDGNLSTINVAPGAVINATNENSYVAMIAPRIVQGGTVTVNGAAAYVAGEQATIDFANGLFSIDVTRGTTDANGIVHQGTTTGPGSTDPSDPHRIAMVAVPKNNAITMLVGGDLGYGASGAGIVNGTVELYSGYDIPDGIVVTRDDSGFASNIEVRNTDLSSDLTARSSGDASLIASNGQVFSSANVALVANGNASATANANMIVLGNLSLNAADGGQGGIARAVVGFENGYGGLLDVGGNLLLDATGTGILAGGAGRGGIAELLVTAGSVNVTGSTMVAASGIGGIGGGDGFGGTARISVTGGSADFQDVSLSAGGFGNGDFNSPVLNGGDGIGGTAEFTQSTDDVTATALSISANGRGGENDASLPGGSGGSGSGGLARLIGGGGTLDVTGGLSISATGTGGAGTSIGGLATGGDALVQLTGGNTTLGFATLDITATGGTAAAGGTDGGADNGAHAARITADGIGTLLTVAGSLIVTADAQTSGGGASGGAITAGTVQLEALNGAAIDVDGGFNQFTASAFAPGSGVVPDATGAARGGSVSIGATGGSLDFAGFTSASADASSGDASVSAANASGGQVSLFARGGGGVLTFNDFLAVSADATAGAGQSGANAIAGSILAFAEDGTLNIPFFAEFSATGIVGFNQSGLNPGTGTGGAITVETRGTAANLSAINLGDLTARAEGFGFIDIEGFIPRSGNAGAGVGGAIAVNALGGTFSANALTLSADAEGGISASLGSGQPGSTGGNGTGGTASFALNGGIATVTTLDISATGTGGLADITPDDSTVGALAGTGTGGTAGIDALAGTLTAGTISITADGVGGRGARSNNGATSAGGTGLGGDANVQLGGTATIDAGGLTVLARGTGGEGGSGFLTSNASNGGSATGGSANVSIVGGSLVVPVVALDARGQGGAGGFSEGTGTTGSGGLGMGGSARLFSEGDFFTIDDMSIAARGLGGAGGYSGTLEFGYGTFTPGPGQGGSGGIGVGGSATLRLDFDPVIANLVIDANGLGGAGGDGAVGGDGGDGLGGIDQGGFGGAALDLVFGALTVENATITSDGTGGNGGTGFDGAGGNGGSGSGGDARIAVRGTSSILTLSPDASRNFTTLSAHGLGGNAGISSTIAAGAGSTGGNGGSGTGGTARFDILDGGQALAGQFVSIAATGTGGGGSDGTSGTIGGAGGLGGLGIGGIALLNIDGGSLAAFDPASPLDWAIEANGFGGGGGLGGDGSDVGATGGAGGSGGIGRGGSALITASDALYQLGAIFLDAEGFGGSGSFGGVGAGDPGATPPIPPSFAPFGNGGDGSGGIAGFSNGDDGVTPPAGSRSVTSLTMRAEGTNGPIADSPTTIGHAGRVELTDTAAAAGGSAQIGDLFASSLGLIGTPGAGFYLTSTGGPLSVVNNASIDTAGPAEFSFNSTGSFLIGGNLQVSAGGDIIVTHSNRPSASMSIVADGTRFSTLSNFDAQPGSVIDSATSLIIEALGNIAAADLRATDLISAQAIGNVTIGNASVDGAVASLGSGAPSGGLIEIIAGLAPGTKTGIFAPADATVTGTITATGTIHIDAGRDILIQNNARLLSDNRVELRAGDDIIVRGDIRAAINPLAESGYGAADPLLAAALLSLHAGGVQTASLGEISSVIVPGSLQAMDRAVILIGDAIQADRSQFIPQTSILAGSLYASITDAPPVAAAASNDGGQLAVDCVQGNVCLGRLFTNRIISIGAGADLPNQVRLGEGSALDTVIRARDSLTFGNGTASFSLAGSNRLVLTSLLGDITLSGPIFVNGGQTRIYAGGDISGPSASISGVNLGLFTGGDLLINQLVSGGMLQTIDADGNIVRDDGFETTGSVTILSRLAAAGAVIEAGTGINVATAEVAGNSIDFRSQTSLVRLGSAGQFGQSVSHVLLRGGTVQAGDVSATGVAILDATAGNATVGTLNAAGGIDIASSGAVTVGTATSGDDILIDATGAIVFQTLDATADVTLNAGGAVTGTDIDAGGAFSVDAIGDTRFATLDGASGIIIQSGVGVVVSTDIASNGAIRVTGGSVALTAIGDLTVTNGQATAGNLALSAGGNLNALASGASGNLTLAGTDVTVGAATAGSGLTVTARGNASFGGVATGQTVTVSSRDIAIGPNGRLGAIGTTNAVNLTNSDASRQTFIGGPDNSAGYSLSAAEIARIFGGSIGITAPRVATQSSLSVGSSRAPDVIVGAFTLTGRAGGASGNLGAGALRISTPGKLRVNGAVQLTGLGTGNRFEIDATDAIEIDAATGSIDMRDAMGGLGGVLALSSDDIIAASLQAISDVGAAMTIDAIENRLALNDGAVNDDGYLRAGRIQVTTRNGFYVQNSGASDEFADRRGFTVGSGGVEITTSSASSRVVINGRQSDGTGGFVTGVDLIDVVRINGQTGRAVRRIDNRSTINGCLIANPLLCAGIIIPDTALSRDIFEAPIDPENAEEAASQLFPLTLIELKEFEPFGFEPLIDEPVTGAGNDDLWVPECDPATEECTQPQQ